MMINIVLLGGRLYAGQVKREAWMGHLGQRFPIVICNHSQYQKCFKANRDECLVTAAMATRKCLDQWREKIPERFDGVLDGPGWSEKVGNCAEELHKKAMVAKRAQSDLSDCKDWLGPPTSNKIIGMTVCSLNASEFASGIIYKSQSECLSSGIFKAIMGKKSKCSFVCQEDDPDLNIAETVKNRLPGETFKIFFEDNNDRLGAISLLYFTYRRMKTNGESDYESKRKMDTLCNDFRSKLAHFVKDSQKIACALPVRP